jgi:SAM-dependent methyltransferase
MTAGGVIESIRQLELPNSFTVDNYAGHHAALYHRLSSRAAGGLEPYVDRISPDARVLDLACGAGRLAEKLVGQGNDVVGVDLAEAMLDRARAQVDAVPRSRPGRGTAEFVCADIRTWRPDSAFDVVTVVGLTLSLFAPEDRAAILRTAAACVRPGGRVLVDFLPADGVSDDTRLYVVPVRLAAMRGFSLIEARRDATARTQLADLYTELSRSDGQVVRMFSSTTSVLLATRAVLAEAAVAGLSPLRPDEPAERITFGNQELGCLVEFERTR